MDSEQKQSRTYPSCGHCPTCGQTPQKMAPWYPKIPTPWINPYTQPIWYSDPNGTLICSTTINPEVTSC